MRRIRVLLAAATDQMLLIQEGHPVVMVVEEVPSEVALITRPGKIDIVEALPEPRRKRFPRPPMKLTKKGR